MEKRMTKIFALLALMLLIFCSSATSLQVFATSVTTQEAELALSTALQAGKSSRAGATSYAGKKYSYDGGGYATWTELVDGSSPSTGYLKTANFDLLTDSAKKELLSDMIAISNDCISNEVGDEGGVDASTQNTWLSNLQTSAGVGTQLITTLLSSTKPDYVTANKIYQPFSGIVGTLLGLGAILIMSALALTMVVDLSYIAIPAFRMLIDGEGGDSGEGKKGKAKLVSYEAINAVQIAENGEGGQGQNGGSNKVAVGIYFKKRVIMLIILGICLLYLVQGQIFTLVGWILDLVSGFLGF